MADDTTAVRSYFENHPKALSALFGLLVLLTQVGTVAAGNSTGCAGP